MKRLYLCITLMVASLVCNACTFYTRPLGVKFTPLGAGVHEMIEIVVHDAKKCTGRDYTCERKTSHDNYEESRINAMDNDELIQHVEKVKSK